MPGIGDSMCQGDVSGEGRGDAMMAVADGPWQ